MSLKPELFDDGYLDNIIHQVYNHCIDKDCENCPNKNELDVLDDGSSVCKTDIVLELWRRWQNARSQNHAKWITLHTQPHISYQCSECGRKVSLQSDRCPSCLARMDKCCM